MALTPTVPVQPDPEVANLLDGMSNTGFQGRKLGESFHIWQKMLEDPDCTILLGLSGAMIPAGMQQCLITLAERHYIDAIVSTGARILKDYRPTIAGLSGQQHAATYYMLGAYSYLIELWGSPVYEADIDGDNEVSDDEFSKWIDIELLGEGWIEPHKFKHPDLGEIWISLNSRNSKMLCRTIIL
jgi:hypothetical protein